MQNVIGKLSKKFEKYKKNKRKFENANYYKKKKVIWNGLITEIYPF